MNWVISKVGKNEAKGTNFIEKIWQYRSETNIIISKNHKSDAKLTGLYQKYAIRKQNELVIL
jgi:hypothetical protein